MKKRSFLLLSKSNFSLFYFSLLIFSFLIILNPSSPTLVIAAEVTLQWGPSTKATGYKLHYGNESKFYQNSIDVGLNLQHTLMGLDNNQMYYFAVTAYNEFGESDFSEEIHYTPGIPALLTIKANGSEGPITISTVDTLSVTIAMQANKLSSKNCDWWCAAQTPSDWYSYDYESDQWIEGLYVTYMGPCADISTREVGNLKLPAGDFIFYFGVDDNMNGTVDGNLYYDRIDVTVAP